MAKITHVKKRDGAIVPFDEKKIEEAISKALTATNEADGRKAKRLAKKVVKILERRFKKNEIPHVEQIQDIVEEVLILEGLVETAKAYILYREQRRRIREAVAVSEEAVERIDQYLEKLDWEVQENANMAFSLQGLNHYGVSYIVKKYWLNKIYPPEIRKANESGDFHIHNLDTLGPYCMGWDLYDLLMKGFGGVPGKVESKPAKHFNTALMQCVNFLYTLQGECYSEDTQVLTENGWKYFYEVKKGEKVFTLNPKTNKIELQEPYRFYEYDFEGELYNFKSKKADLLVTPGHRMLVDQYSPYSKEKYRKKFVEAKNFNPNTQFIPKGGDWEGKEEKYFVLPAIQIFQIRNYREIPFAKNLAFLTNTSEVFGEVLSIGDLKIKTPQPKFRYQLVEVLEKKILMDDWLKFFGFWLAEGSTTLRKRKRRERKNPYYEYQVRISQNEGKKTEEFEKVLKRLPFNYMKKKSGKKIEFVILNKQLFLYLRQFGKHEEKFIPKEIKNLSKRQLKILFDWMMRGDGYIGNGNIDYYTKSKKLADDIQEIALKLGLSANIYEKRKGKFKWYRVAISKTKHFRFKKENIKKVNYKGKVYCLEVPNHTLYVRRNRKALWCGNCAGAVSFSNFDTLLAPFIRYDNLNYQQVKQALQEFLFNMAIPTRVGFQTPFSNITLDLKPSPVYAKMPVIIGGKPQDKTYSEFEEEMKIFDKALYEVYMEGDAKGRPFHFPIPTINITKDFPWNEPAFEGIFEASAKYGINYFANYINSEMKPEDVRSMCLEANEEILIRNSKKIKRLTIKDVAENYKDGEFDKEGWVECKKEGNLEVLSLNPETLKLEWVPVKRFLKIKDDKAVEVITEDGKRAIFSMKHPMAIYASNGIQMKFAKDIKIGEKILVTNSLQHLQKTGNSEDKLKLKKVQPIPIKEVKLKKYKKLKEFYDIELERNHLFVHSLGQISFNCCRLRLDLTELYNRGGGGLFGSGSKTGCYDEKTEILTENGWKYFKDLTLEDKVFTLTDDNRIELHHPIRLFEYNYEGKMIHFKSRTFDLLVTPNHRMVVDHKYKGKRMFVEAKDFKPYQHYIPKGGIWEGEEKEWFVLPPVVILQGAGPQSKFSEEELQTIRQLKNEGKTIYQIAESFNCSPVTISNVCTKENYGNRERVRIRYEAPPLKIKMDDWLKFFGIWLAEGSTDNEKIAPDHGYRVVISQKSKEKREQIKEVLNRLPFNYSEERDTFVIHNKQLWAYLRQFGNKYTKFISKEIKNLSRRQLKILFDWMVKGDGYVRKTNGQINYWTASKRLADDLQEIILKLGWHATIKERKKKTSQIKGREVKTNVVYEIGVHRKTKHFTFTHKERIKNQIREVYYKGKVYCCEVSNHTVYVRRNGKATWCGNSIGVVTINLPRIGYLSKTKKEFFERLARVMDLAKESLEIKRKTIENFIEKGLYPYSRYYLQDIKQMRGKYWANHFSTIGLVGMNECLLNFMGENIATKRGRKFALEVLDFMRERLVKYQEETGNIYNLEATPAESTAFRLALKDKEKYPDIITAGTKKVPYYTNSSMLPVNFTDDLFEALKLQDEIQCKYTGGVVFHIFLGERMQNGEGVKRLVKKVFENFKLPYITITPTFSICPVHGYLEGEHFFCPKCIVKQPCEVYSRIVGYLRPVQQWNLGKQQEFHQRKVFKISEKEL